MNENMKKLIVVAGLVILVMIGIRGCALVSEFLEIFEGGPTTSAEALACLTKGAGVWCDASLYSDNYFWSRVKFEKPNKVTVWWARPAATDWGQPDFTGVFEIGTSKYTDTGSRYWYATGNGLGRFIIMQSDPRQATDGEYHFMRRDKFPFSE